MENERKAREQEEKDRVERMKKIKDQFADPNGQWEKDKTDIQNEAMKEKKEQEKTKEQQTLDDSKPAEGASSESKSGAAKPGESPAEVSCTSNNCHFTCANEDRGRSNHEYCYDRRIARVVSRYPIRASRSFSIRSVELKTCKVCLWTVRFNGAKVRLHIGPDHGISHVIIVEGVAVDNPAATVY